MTATHWDTFTAARAHLRDVLDAAHSGRVTTLSRDGESFVVSAAVPLRAQLARLVPSNAVVVAEGGGWAAVLPGVPLGGDGDSVDDAVDDLIDALREYAEDWNDHLRLAPNHAGFAALVTLVELSSDQQLLDWIEGTPDEPATASRADLAAAGS